jgi:3-phenylpropionate/trans-cinnamate dioxygenase ferredoxin reductase component
MAAARRMTDPIVIIGAGQAGARTAAALREAGYSGPVELVGDEAELPYERPPLSKGILTGHMLSSDLQVLPSSYYVEKDITLRLGQYVTELDAVRHRVTLASGTSLPYSRVVLATGGRARPVPIQTGQVDGIRYLRSLKDAAGLRDALRSASALVVVGGGFLGLEVAASARSLGLGVTLIELRPQLLDRIVESEIATLIGNLHRRHGVTLRLGVGFAGILHGPTSPAVALTDGTSLSADVVVAATGMRPNTALAAQAGCTLDDGVIVDEYGATSVDGVFAVGDVAQHLNGFLGRHVRPENWQTAQNQAIAVGRGLAGDRRPYAEVPWFWSDQYGTSIQILGMPEKTDEIVVRGDVATNRFVVLNLSQGQLVGATACNMAREIPPLRQIMKKHLPIDAGTAADITRPLHELARAERRDRPVMTIGD